MSEFELIEYYFMRDESEKVQNKGEGRSFIGLGQGDDCALLMPDPKMHLAVSTDMLIEGQHFLPDTDPFKLGQKTLAVNLSDLAAMGAEPRAFTMAISLPSIDAKWISEFTNGIYTLATSYQCPLIGGDTTRGPLTISITIFGEVPIGKALRRDGACHEEDIWISGVLGEARLGLDLLLGKWKGLFLEKDCTTAIAAQECPTPRIELGKYLRYIATSAIDLSDGLVSDLNHLMKHSNLIAHIELGKLPHTELLDMLPREKALECMLTGGDDYELCFTAPPTSRVILDEIAILTGLKLTRIGVTTLSSQFPDSSLKQGSIFFTGSDINFLNFPLRGFDHFYEN